MEELYLLSIIPPGEALSRIGPVREELYRQFGMTSARMLPDMVPLTVLSSFAEPPKESRCRIRISTAFTLEPGPVTDGGAVFLPLTENEAWDEVRESPVIAALTAPAGPQPAGGTQLGGAQPRGRPPRARVLFPYPGVFLGFASELDPENAPELNAGPGRPPGRPSPPLPRMTGPVTWKKSSLVCLRILLAGPAGEKTGEALWEIFWKIPVVSRG